jgi:lipopolysaccharide biosynthesis regulator YciM
VLRQLAQDYLDLEDVNTAERALKEIIALDSRDRWAHVTLLQLQEQARNWDDAFHTADQMLRLEGNKSKKPLARYKFEMGQQLYRKREYHKARIIFKEAIGLDPTYVPAYLAIGDSYNEEDRSEDAVTFWNKMITAVPEKGHLVIDRLKKTLFDLGRFGEIVAICENILEHDPKNVQSRRTLAEIQQKKGDLNAAAELLQAVLDDRPDDIDSVVELCRIYLEKGDTRKVLSVLQRFQSKRESQMNASTGDSTQASTVGA